MFLLYICNDLIVFLNLSVERGISKIMSSSTVTSSGLPTHKPLKKYGAGSQPFTVLIEGNIGSGKTTFLNHFQQYEDDICLITEPVEKWRNVGDGNNLLVSIFLFAAFPPKMFSFVLALIYVYSIFSIGTYVQRTWPLGNALSILCYTDNATKSYAANE